MSEPATQSVYRTLMISDLHLGSFRCKTRSLQEFLASVRAKTVFLVGDTVDFWSMQARTTWVAEKSKILHRLYQLVLGGSRIVLIPGNHDEALGQFTELPDIGIEIHHEFIHETVGGERFLVVHGHEQDTNLHRFETLALAGCAFREWVGGTARQLLGTSGTRRPSRFSASLGRIRRYVGGIDRLELTLAEEARRRRLDGVICGHTHFPADRELAGVRYLNCGDWIRNCTAIAETWSGEIKLIHWPTLSEARKNGQRSKAPAWSAVPAPLRAGTAQEAS